MKVWIALAAVKPEAQKRPTMAMPSWPRTKGVGVASGLWSLKRVWFVQRCSKHSVRESRGTGPSCLERLPVWPERGPDYLPAAAEILANLRRRRRWP